MVITTIAHMKSKVVNLASTLFSESKYGFVDTATPSATSITQATIARTHMATSAAVSGALAGTTLHGPAFRPPYLTRARQPSSRSLLTRGRRRNRLIQGPSSMADYTCRQFPGRGRLKMRRPNSCPLIPSLSIRSTSLGTVCNCA